jgi:hypothetical protein
VIGLMWRALVLIILVPVVASCGQLFDEDRPWDSWSTHTVRELCRYPLDFFTNRAHRTGLEVIEFIDQDSEIGGVGGCVIDGPDGGLATLTVHTSLAQAEHARSEVPADFQEREAIQVGADTVRVWSRDDGMGRELRVDIDGWIGQLTVVLNKIGEPTDDTALPDEHLPAAAEMLVRMTRDLKGPS